MVLAQTFKSGLFCLLGSIVVLSGAGISFSQPQEQEPVLGELKLQGKYIERLVLDRKDGRTEQLNRPEETIKLTEGEYRLNEVRLKGGYVCTYSRFAARDWVTVAPDKTAVLKVGAPLKQTIKVRRKGKILVMSYELLGVGGEHYASRNRTKPPIFAVYKGDKKIHSGKFEFG